MRDFERPEKSAKEFDVRIFDSIILVVTEPTSDCLCTVVWSHYHCQGAGVLAETTSPRILYLRKGFSDHAAHKGQSDVNSHFKFMAGRSSSRFRSP